MAQPLIRRAERRAVDRVLRSGMLAQGPEVAAFEEEFSSALGLPAQSVAVNSGTSALHLGLLAVGIGPGDEVIVPSFTFAATANAVALAGAVPVFADIDLQTYTLDPASVAEAIGPRTRAIMPVHLYGHPARMPELESLAAEHDLLLFEDAAQAHGATVGGRPVGAWGAGAAFSFYPTKNMTAAEGGMITLTDDATVRVARLLRNQGMLQQYRNEIVGFNTRMTDIHAAIGRVQLRSLERWTARRRQIAAVYDRELHGVVVPQVRDDATHVYHQYTIRLEGDRDRAVTALLDEHGVRAGVYYPVPVHRLQPFSSAEPRTALDSTEAAASSVVSIPVHPALSSRQVARVVDAVNAVARAGAS